MPNRTTRAKDFGFTLIEVMVTVVIVAILASIAVPSYLSSVRDSRRADAKQAILAAAQTMESFYAMNMTYAGSANGTTPTIFTAKVPKDGSEHYYTLTLDPAPGATTYTIKAVPKAGSSQASDRCGTLSLTRAGVRSAAQADCW